MQRVLMGPVVGALVSAPCSPTPLRSLDGLVAVIRTPLVDEQHASGELPPARGPTVRSRTLSGCAPALELCLGVAYYGELQRCSRRRRPCTSSGWCRAPPRCARLHSKQGRRSRRESEPIAACVLQRQRGCNVMQFELCSGRWPWWRTRISSNSCAYMRQRTRYFCHLSHGFLVVLTNSCIFCNVIDFFFEKEVKTPLSISTFLPSTSSALHSSFQFQPQSMSAMKITLLAVAAMAVLLGTASAVTYGVGEPGGSWTLGTDYNNWVADKKFQLRDEIVFKYSSAAHDVIEVSKAGYDSCSTAGAINTFKSGNDVVPLNVTGTRYFICGITGHCSPTDAASMKVVIDVASGSSSPSSPMPAAGPGASNSPPAPPSSAATSVGATAGFGLVALLAAGLMA